MITYSHTADVATDDLPVERYIMWRKICCKHEGKFVQLATLISNPLEKKGREMFKKLCSDCTHSHITFLLTQLLCYALTLALVHGTPNDNLNGKSLVSESRKVEFRVQRSIISCPVFSVAALAIIFLAQLT